MSVSNSMLAYRDCYQVLDQALQDQQGVRLPMRDKNAATYLRMRIHQARALDRVRNAQVYKDQKDHPLFGASEYDQLMLRIKEEDGKAYLYIEYVQALEYAVEPLSGLPPPEPQRLLPPPEEEAEIAEGQALEPMEIEVIPPAEPVVRRKIV